MIWKSCELIPMGLQAGGIACNLEKKISMPFMCPKCNNTGSLEIAASIELPPDSAWDEISLQVVECSNCGFSGPAVYEESRRGSLDDEAWNHQGFTMDDLSLAILKRTIKKCPNPKNSRCKCSSHAELGRADLHGTWIGIQGLGEQAPYNLQLLKWWKKK